ncbi:MAG: HlyD family secretion protein [Candidatus Acidiferrales bacterium]
MTARKFVGLIAVVFVVVLAIYLITMPRGNSMNLIGVIDGNEVIVSPQVTGRIIKLTVDEGSEVKKGDLIAELDREQLEASLAAAQANVASLGAQVREANHNYSWTNAQTDASLDEQRAQGASMNAQLDQARAMLDRDQRDFQRMQELFGKGEVSAQQRDHAQTTVEIDQASVDAIQESVKAQTAALAVAQANRKQVDVRQSQLSTTLAQLEQARASEDEARTQLGYTEIYAPIAGIVSVRVARQGEVVEQGSPIVVVVDVDHLWVRADVPETYIDRIQFGETLRVQLPSGDTLEGQVFFKGVENDFATERDVSRTKRDIKTFAIKVSVPNPGRRLFTGMTATVLLPPPAEKKSWFAWL